MSEPGLPDQYIVFDADARRVRLTHRPSGESVTRPTHVEGADVRPWMDAFSAFLARHAEARALIDLQGRMIGDAKDFPAAGGGFAVGDLVVSLQSGGRAVARRVMSAFEDGPRTNREADCAPFSYLLEDGRTLRYSQINVAWQAPNPSGTHVATRRAFPGEDVEAIRIPVETVVMAALSDACSKLLTVRGDESLKRVVSSEAALMNAEYAKELDIRLVDAESEIEETSSEAALDAGAKVLDEVRDFLASLADAHRNSGIGDERGERRFRRWLDQMDAVGEGLRLRGVGIDTPAPGL